MVIFAKVDALGCAYDVTSIKKSNSLPENLSTANLKHKANHIDLVMPELQHCHQN